MVSGINWKRMAISLVLAAIFGIICAYGTSTVDIPGVVITFPLLVTIFYARLLIGFVIGISEQIQILKGEMSNAALRGAIMGAIVSIVVSMFGGGEIMIAAGIVYGIIIDILATRFG
jgi:hypothetical protein